VTVRVIKDHIVVKTATPGRLRALFPEVREAIIGPDTYCAVPNSLDCARVLNNIGIPVPSPIMSYYDWPGRYKPRWYQHETSSFLTLNPRCYCLSAPRTGKTLSSLWAADYLRTIGKVQKTLIVAPLSTLWDVWEQNIFESFPFRTFCVLYGTRAKRIELLSKPFDFYITNHHGVQLLEKDLRERPDINLVIIDEIAELRNSKNKSGTLWAPMNRVLNQQNIVRSAWGLTGTPTPNEPPDAFGQCKLITPENYKGHYTSFKNETMVRFGPFKWVERRGAEEAVARILKPSIRFERSVCSDMEPCFIERRAQMSDEQTKAYKQLIQQAATEVRGSTVTAVNAAVLASKITQIACGCVIAADGSIARLDFGPRLGVLKELIEGNTEKVIVFVPFTAVLDALATELRKHWSVAIVDGGVSPSKRTQIFRDFRTLKDPHILLAQPDCMSHGLDLTAASLSIWYAPHTKAAKYQQANARTDGSKQTVKIDIAKIYATAEERRIYSVLEGKGNFQDVVLALAREGM